MRRWMAGWILCLAAWMLCAPVLAQEGVYTYGGSARDWMNGAAIAPDGRIAVTGYTLSSDGTLSDRTKTWRAGWVMMLSGDMQVQWNFCSRSGDADHMHCPVFHEDGTLTVVHETEGKQMKIVRIDANGSEVSSATVLSNPAEDTVFGVEGATARGYMLSEIRGYGQRRIYRFFDWDGQELSRYEEWDSVAAVGKMHILLSGSGKMSLYALGGDGGWTRLSDVCAAKADGTYDRSYSCLISLPDGGAAACGSAWEGWNQGPVDRKGVISRWDAQGNLVFEMFMELGPLVQMVKTPYGFAATAYAQAELSQPVRWHVLAFDEAGLMTGMDALGETASSASGDAGPLVCRADGTLAVMMHSGQSGSEDVQAVVF